MLKHALPSHHHYNFSNAARYNDSHCFGIILRIHTCPEGSREGELELTICEYSWPVKESFFAVLVTQRAHMQCVCVCAERVFTLSHTAP